MKTHCLFVYGSLLTGTDLPTIDVILRRRGRYLGQAFAHGYLYDLGAYPGMVADPNPYARVYGALYHLRSARHDLPRLDRYEGYDPEQPQTSEFERRQTTVWLLPERRPVAAWVYYYRGAVRFRRRIRSGRYRTRGAAT